MLKLMRSRCDGRCQGCGGTFQRRDWILWAQDDGPYHKACDPSRTGTPRDRLPAHWFEESLHAPQQTETSAPTS